MAHNPIDDLREALAIVEQAELNINDDEILPEWVLTMIDDLKAELTESIDFHASKPWERAS